MSTVQSPLSGTTTVTLGTVVATVDPSEVTVVAVVVTSEVVESTSASSTSKTESTTSTTTKKTTSTTTTVSIPTATEFCAKNVIENEDTSLDKYGSEYDEFVFVMWGIQWDGLGSADAESEIEGILEDCGITADIHVAVDTTEWGTVAMWNNGENDVITPCVELKIKALGGGTPSCKWIYKTSEDVNYSAKDSAEAEMTWIYNNHKSVISALYPLAT